MSLWLLITPLLHHYFMDFNMPCRTQHHRVRINNHQAPVPREVLQSPPEGNVTVSGSFPWVSWPQGFQADFSLSWDTRAATSPLCSGLRALTFHIKTCCCHHAQAQRSECPAELLHFAFVFWRGNQSILADPAWWSISIWAQCSTGPICRRHWRHPERCSTSLTQT